MDEVVEFNELHVYDATKFYNDVAQELDGQVLAQVVRHIASATKRSIRISVLQHVVCLLDGNVSLIEGLGKFLKGNIDVMTRGDGSRVALLYDGTCSVRELWRDGRINREAGVTLRPNQDTSEKRIIKQEFRSEESTDDEKDDMLVDDKETACLPDVPTSSVVKPSILAARKRDGRKQGKLKTSDALGEDESSKLAPAQYNERRKRLRSSDTVEDKPPTSETGNRYARPAPTDQDKDFRFSDHRDDDDDDDYSSRLPAARNDEEQTNVAITEAGDKERATKVLPLRAARKMVEQVGKSPYNDEDDESRFTESESDVESLDSPDILMLQTVMDAIFSRLDMDNPTVEPARIDLALHNGRISKTSHTNVLSLDERRKPRQEGTILVALSSVAPNIFDSLDEEITSESYTIGVAINSSATYEATVDVSQPPHEVCSKTTVVFTRLGRLVDLTMRQISNLRRACQDDGVNVHQIEIDFKELWDATYIDLPNDFRDGAVG